MNLPTDKIKILYRDYKLSALSPTTADGGDRFGDTDKSDGHIRVCLLYDRHQVGNTLVHEILHALMDAMHLDLKRIKNEEDLVNPLANGLTAVIRDNPLLWQWIIKACL